MSARHNVARSLAPYQRIAVWGAGSLAALAMDRWLPRERVVAVLDSDPAKQGKPFYGLPVSDPAATDLHRFDVIVVCISAYLEAFERLVQLGYEAPFFYIYELMVQPGEERQSELQKLWIDYQRARRRNLFFTILSRPQFLTVVTYRLTRHFNQSRIFRPLFYLMLFFHHIICLLNKIELPYTVSAGPGLLFEHIGGAVFHDRCEIGSWFTIYQFTTIGSDDTGGVPKIGSFVSVYSSALVIGNCQIGDHSRIGGNTTAIGVSCPPGSTLVGTPARIVATKASAILQGRRSSFK